MEDKQSREASAAHNDGQAAQLTAPVDNTQQSKDSTADQASAALSPDLTLPKGRLALSALVIVVVGSLAYLNSFEGAFLFDDLLWLADPSVQTLWPPSHVMLAPIHVSRPLIGLSLAINFAISEFNPWSYHAFNLAAHLLAALTLFGIVRRTLLSQPLHQRFGNAALPLALVVALIWMVHPLQTQSVTYIIQRAESWMGMFYLLTLYCAIRSFHSSHKPWWYGAAIAACAAGALSKQVIVTAPLLVLLYDVLFHYRSWQAALRQRWGLYVGLVASWGLLVATTIAAPKLQTAGFTVTTLTPWEYLKSQPEVIVYYLRLALWPDVLCFDYGWKKASALSEIVPYALVVLVLVAASLWGLWKGRASSYLGLWFFLILSLTSSLMPLDDLIFEHRMYLSLAAVVAVVVLGAYEWGKRLLERLYKSEAQRAQMGRLAAITLATLLVASLSLLTLGRNVDYKSDLVIWSDAVKKYPLNARALTNLGRALFERGRAEEALLYYSRACEIEPDRIEPKINICRVLIAQGKFEEAKTHLDEALRISPKDVPTNMTMGQYLAFQGQFDEALKYFRQILEVNPNNDSAYHEIGKVLELQGKLKEAVAQYDRALQLNPKQVEWLGHLAFILATQRDAEIRNLEKALGLAERAVLLTKGQQPFPMFVLAAVYAEAGRFAEAVDKGEEAKRLATEKGEPKLIEAIETQLKFYKEGRVSPLKPPQTAK